MSILLMLVCAAHSSPQKFYHRHDNDGEIQPIGSKSPKQRICAELCLAGLAGKACGESCLDIPPTGKPRQSALATLVANVTTPERRQGACTVICENKLQYSQCNCSRVTQKEEADLEGVCRFSCLYYNYKIDGCPECNVNGSMEKTTSTSTTTTTTTTTTATPVIIINPLTATNGLKAAQMDWDEWCREKCSIGDGGVACNCDILPILAQFTV